MDSGFLKASIEAILYAAEEPVSLEQLQKVFPDQDVTALEGVIQDLIASYEGDDRGVALRPVAGGYRLSTKMQFHEQVRTFIQERPAFKLSMAALETLAIVAYRQPITAPEILQTRGVKSTGAIKTLLEKRLIAPRGRRRAVGSPMLYGTSKEFLIRFGLNSIQDLPSLEDFEDIFGERMETIKQRSLFDLGPRKPPLTFDEDMSATNAEEGEQ